MKDLIKSSTIYILLGFLPTGVNFVMVNLLTSYLTKAEYGLLSISALFQGLVAIFMNIGLDAAFARYYFNVYKKRKLLHAYYSTVLLSVLGISFLLFTLLLFVGDPFLQLLFKNNRYHFSDYGLVTFVLALFTIIHTVILTYYRNEENLKMYSIISIVTLIFSVSGILIGVVWLNKGAYGNICGRSVAFSGIVLLYLGWYFRNRKLVIRWSYLKEMLNYGIPFIPYFVILFLGSSLDQWMIERRFSLAQLGEYNFGLLLASLVSVFTYAVFNAISPKLYKLMAENDPVYDNEIRNLNRIFHFVVVFAITAELAIISPFTVLFIKNTAYHAMLDYIPLLILVWLPHLYYMLYVVPLMFHNKTRYLPLIMLISLSVGLASNLILIPLWGVIGVCVSAIIIKMTSFAVTAFISKQLRILEPKHFRLQKNHLLAILVFVAFIAVYLANDYFKQSYRLWINLIPLLVFLLYSLVAFRKEINIVLTLFSKKKTQV
ncbi:MAG TPA: oligosaccharide flippase family protein [Fluviicola sp.]|nr:oligosaccharide flippase family protein [Fluviicola sp.]